MELEYDSGGEPLEQEGEAPEGQVATISGMFHTLVDRLDRDARFFRSVAGMAMARGNEDGARRALQRAQQIASLRQRLAEVGDVWNAITDEAAERQATRAQVPGSNAARRFLGRSDLYLPVLRALEILGGAAPLETVLAQVEKLLQGQLTQSDYSSTPSYPITPRWHVCAQRARKALVEMGLLSGESQRGVWGITDAGRRYLNKLSQS